MAWDHLSIDKPHLVYLILGGFTSLFMLCSSIIKERLYIGEATVATICGIIFGPHAADLIDPGTWGNTDQITLEFSRIVLVVQCFAVGVELPKAYMEKHWRSVVLLLVPVMTFGWLITSLFIWAMMYNQLNWLDSLTIAACVTATDPVLASSVVGKGKFAKRVPKHLRDLLSAESGCNDGMAFPFIYLALYLVRYRPNADEVSLNWFCITILYECVFGAIYGVIVGYLARRAIRFAHERDLIDRESFLVFYFVLALFCAGSGSILGIDDLLVGFACGVGFSNDGWFGEKTEESHVSNVIDLLINLSFFVYFGTIIPWAQYASSNIGLTPWRLVVIALLVIFFRRIPIMLALKPIIPDIKTWREALFAGHFGPIGVGALYVAILARAEIETDSGTPLAKIPPAGFEHRNIIELIWPITTFLVIASIVVHGSSIAVFTLGKHINTLTITMSYTQANEEGYSWMERLPRIQSRSKSSMSLQRDTSEESLEEKLPAYPSGAAFPRHFLRRQKETDSPRSPRSPRTSRPSSRSRKSRRWDSGRGPGGPVEDSAITPRRRTEELDDEYTEKSEPTTPIVQHHSSNDTSEEATSSNEKSDHEDVKVNAYEESKHTAFEDGDGNVLEVMDSKGQTAQDRRRDAEDEAKNLIMQQASQEGQPQDLNVVENATKKLEKLEQEAKQGNLALTSTKQTLKGKMSGLTERMRRRTVSEGSEVPETAQPQSQPGRRKPGPARAFRFGRTIIVEDEDGEVIRKFDIPDPTKERPKLERKQSYVDPDKARQTFQRVGQWLGVGGEIKEEDVEGSATNTGAEQITRRPSELERDREDQFLRFTIDGGSRRMSKADFIKQIQMLDPKSRVEVIAEDDGNEEKKDTVDRPGDAGKTTRQDAKSPARRGSKQRDTSKPRDDSEKREDSKSRTNTSARDESSKRGGSKTRGESQDETSPRSRPQLARAESSKQSISDRESLDRITSKEAEIPFHSVSADIKKASMGAAMAGSETAAQRRRRLAAQQREEDSDDDGTERVPPAARRRGESLRQKTSPPAPSRDDGGETAAERRRREGALGLYKEQSDSDEDETPRQPPKNAVPAEPSSARPGIRFAEAPSQQRDQPPKPGQRISWGLDRGRKK